MVTIYHNPRCAKSRETLKIIHERGVNAKVVEYLKVCPTAEELKKIVQSLGIRPIDLVRKNESIFKEQFKDKDISDSEWLQIMSENPKLIERPIVIKGEKAVIGRPPENVEEIL